MGIYRVCCMLYGLELLTPEALPAASPGTPV
jgi:hypothetical protein